MNLQSLIHITMDENIEITENKTGNELPKICTDNSGQLKANEKSELAFKIFNSSIKRADNLLNINIDPKNNKIPIPEDKLLDSYRAVIVLSISALDAYIKTFLMVAIKKSLNEKVLSPELKKYIKEELFTKDSLHQYVLESNFYETVIEKFDEDFEKRSFQGQKSIDKYMKLAGVNQVFKLVCNSADKSVDKLLVAIENFTQRRHLIVHCGDHDLTQTELKENLITEKDASDCIKLVSLIVNEIHKISQSK
jgi:hypothetical protein